MVIANETRTPPELLAHAYARVHEVLKQAALMQINVT